MADTGSTRQDLIAVVLENLGVLASGQSFTIEDSACVNRRIDPTLATLGRREVFAGLSADALDPGVFLLVADVVAYACRTPFGITGNKAAELKEKAERAEAELRAITRQYSPNAATVEFDPIRQVLETLGVVEAGQDPSAQDVGVAHARIQPALTDLNVRELIATDNYNDLSVAQRRHVASVLVASCAPAFGVRGADLSDMIAAAAAAEKALLAMARQYDTGVATSGTFDVIQVALENLGAVAVGRTGTDKDRAIIAGRVSAVLADLKNREVISIASLDAADPGTLLPLSVVLTSACAMAWGLSAEVRAALAVDAKRAEAQLRLQSRQLDTGAATSGEFDPVQIALEMLGVVSAGQTASEKDRAVVTARVQPLLLELYGRDICGVVDISLLKPELMKPFARLLAADVSLSFPDVPNARLAMLQAMVAPAEQSLRYQSFVYDRAPSLRVERFWGRRHGCGPLGFDIGNC